MAPVFDGLVGQGTAIALLQRAVQQQRVAPAYLFAGPEGVGRRLGAERFAELLFSRRDEGDLGLRRRLSQRNHPDLLWVEPTYLHQGRLVPLSEAQDLKRKSPPQIRLEQVRQIAQFLSRPPLEAPRAMVVIESAETMAEGAANGLLKTLEEPGQATIILLAPGAQALLPTLVSRCQTIPFQRLNRADMALVLQRLGHDEVLQHPQVLALAQGSPGGAIAAYQQLQTIPADLLKTFQHPPTSLQEALERGRQVAKTLDTEAQLWLLDYLQQEYWQADPPGRISWLPHLEQAKVHLRRFVQPRLVWEVLWMQLWQASTPSPLPPSAASGLSGR
jgi:DNA polymerase-3 subunit delta'